MCTRSIVECSFFDKFIVQSLVVEQMAKGPINIIKSFNGYKVHGIRFHIRARSANNKTYSCGFVVKGTTAADLGGANYYGVLEEVLKAKYLGEPIKYCVPFCCNWFDPSNPRDCLLYTSPSPRD